MLLSRLGPRRLCTSACVTYPSYVPVIHVAESLTAADGSYAEARAYKAETVTQVRCHERCGPAYGWVGGCVRHQPAAQAGACGHWCCSSFAGVLCAGLPADLHPLITVR